MSRKQFTLYGLLVIVLFNLIYNTFLPNTLTANEAYYYGLGVIQMIIVYAIAK